MKYIFAIITILFLVATPVLASEWNNNLNTGVGNIQQGIVIPKFVTPDGLSSLITTGVFVLPNGATSNSTPSISLSQEITITVDKSSVLIPDKTIITETTGKSFDATALTAGVVNETSLSGLGTGKVVEGALQWGIAELHLSFSPAISLSIFVGTDLKGQTLNIQRSSSKTGGWTSDGIVSATCVITADGFCNFQATSASYYATYRTETTNGGGNTGGGGGGGGSPVNNTSTSSVQTTTTAKSGDANNDSKIDELDFSLLMADWNKTGTSSADLNKDNVVDELDFSLLMANWSL